MWGHVRHKGTVPNKYDTHMLVPVLNQVPGTRYYIYTTGTRVLCTGYQVPVACISVKYIKVCTCGTSTVPILILYPYRVLYPGTCMGMLCIMYSLDINRVSVKFIIL